MKKELMKNTRIIALGKFSTQVISYLLLPLYTSVLTTSEYGIYDFLVKYCGGGAMTPITNFGYTLTKSALEGAKEGGVLGILKSMLKNSSAVLSFVVIMAFFASLVSKPRP